MANLNWGRVEQCQNILGNKGGGGNNFRDKKAGNKGTRTLPGKGLSFVFANFE